MSSNTLNTTRHQNKQKTYAKWTCCLPNNNLPYNCNLQVWPEIHVDFNYVLKNMKCWSTRTPRPHCELYFIIQSMILVRDNPRERLVCERCVFALQKAHVVYGVCQYHSQVAGRSSVTTQTYPWRRGMRQWPRANELSWRALNFTCWFCILSHCPAAKCGNDIEW